MSGPNPLEAIYAIPPRMKGAWCDGQASYDQMYSQSVNDPDAFWTKIAEQFTWKKKWDKVCVGL